jgi:leader peptidase (prepilin peptidase) / N-methyltransferase
MYLVLVAILGLLFGSFVNAAVWRLKVKKPIANDRSICPKCKHQLRVLDLVPVLSYLWLRGRCRYCHKPISPQYPLVEMATAGLFVWSYTVWALNTISDYVSLGFWLAILVGLIILALYDLKEMLLPDRVLKPLVLLVISWQVALLVLEGDLGAFISHLAAAFVLGLAFYGLYAISSGRWMGGGDVKLVFVLGLILGLSKSLVAMLLAFNTAAIYSLLMLGTRRLSRKDLIPFGPFLIAATVVAQLHGQQLLELYQRLILINL